MEDDKNLKNELYKKVYEIVNKYDLIGIAFVADDEYEPEAIEIANRANILSEDKLAEYIRQVFEFWFGAGLIPKHEAVYKNMAIEIKRICPEK